MRIRKLELHGFKSFPDRTIVEFGDGICCVVGPNGCGKSNIMDAIRWCIGEQSAKSLRGSEMMDVIFAGSEKRAPVGFAEVTIVFTADGSEPFPGEYARFTELSVGRRLHRSGASEYFMNRERCRRKDVVDLFLDTGIGNNLYSFIEQGSIGKIVQASPQERRGMIEEAAGIAKYRARRHEAQQKLEATATQLDRAADVEEELRARLIGVEKQVFKAAKYRRIRARVKQGEVLLGLARYADLTEERKALGKSVRDGTAGQQSVVTKLELHEVAVEEHRDAGLIQEAVVASHRDDAAEQDARHRELDGARGFRERRREELNAETARLNEDQTRVETTRDAARGEIELATADVESLIASVAVAERDRCAREEVLRDAQERRRDAQQRLREVERQAAAAEVRASEARGRLDDLQRRWTSATQAHATNREERSGLAESVDALRERVTSAKAEAQSAADIAREAERQGAQCQIVANEASGVMREAQQRVSAARSSVERLQREAASAAEAGAQALLRLDRTARTEERDRRQAADKRVRRMEQEGREAVSTVARGSDRAISDAERAHRDGVRAAEQMRSRAISIARETAKAAERVCGDEWSSRLQRAQVDTDALQKTAESDADTARSSHISSARQARDVALLTFKEATATQEVVNTSVQTYRSELAGLVAGEESLTERIDSEQRRAVGAESVAERFASHPRLADRGDVPGWASNALGRRLGLPVVTSKEDVLSARAALTEGTASVWWWGEEPVSWDASTRSVEQCVDLDAALTHHISTGGAAVSVSTGDRIDSDGVITLGHDDGGAGQMLALSEELTVVQARRAEVGKALEEATRELAAALQSVEAARVTLDAAETSLETATEDANTVWRQAVDAVRAGNEQQLTALREQRDIALIDVREEAGVVLVTATEVADASLAMAREATRGAIDTARSSREAKLDAARTASREKITALRSELDRESETFAAELESRRDVAQKDVAEARAEAQEIRQRAESELKQQRSAFADVEAQARQAERTRSQAEARRRDAEMAVVRATATAERAESELREVATRIDNLDLSVQGLDRTVASLTTQRDDAQTLVDDAESGASAPREAVDEAQATLAELEAKEEHLRKVVTVADIEIASLKERADGRRSAKETAELRVLEAADDLLRLDQQRKTLNETTATNAAELAGAVEELELVAEERAAAWDRLQQERERLDGLRQALKDLEEKGRKLTEHRDAVAKRLAADEIRSHETQMEIEALEKRIDERYLLSLPGLLDKMDASGRVEVAPEPDVQLPFEVAGRQLDGVPVFTIRPDTLQDYERIEAMVEEVNALRRKLQNLGEVNLAALEEYDEVKERHDNLAAQRDDLERAVAAIRASIAKMNRHCRERFRETFDRVNENFTVAYPRLVGGGMAKLILTDEEDMLATGVDVMVQPPGKRVQNLSLLSGGEKAMCALAMIMSLFQVKPSPFCLLDEVDAPLDEANGTRFNEMLREMSKLAQFIVITHNRKTMEVGNTLYGITMGQPGVSRLVSVQMPASG